MSPVIDIESLLQELSPEQPCGEDLEYDGDFVAMEEASRGKEERQSGDSVLEAEEADWRTVKSLALSLLGRSKDLRIAVYLAQALVSTDGLPGLRDGLQLLQQLIERYWEQVHPLLDADDDNDPTIRVNTLLNLCGQETMLRPIRHVELVNVKGLGRYDYRDYVIAAGTMPAPEGADTPAPGMAEIDAAFMGTEVELIQAQSEALKGSLDLLATIETKLMEKVGTSHAVSLTPTVELLKEINTVIAEQLARRGIDEPGAEEEAGGGPAKSLSGEVNSREDVLRVLDKACEYYRRHEPSSPVPLLLERAKTLVTKDFMEIVRDLAPTGLQEIEKIRGQDSN